ncbi:MAG TPA: hypothetical protein VGE30_01255 [Candidatus Saccharimonadales bacterium]
MKKLFRDQHGFSALEVGLAVIVMGLIGGSGYYVYQQQADDTTETTAISQQEQQTEEAVTVAGAVNTGTADSWTSITTQAVVLPEWDMQMELPESIDNDLLAAYDKLNDSYIFSVKRITENVVCKDYLVGERLLAPHPGLQVARMSTSTKAYSQLGPMVKNESQSLADYYVQHRSNRGSYIEADNGQKYWKVDDYFVTAFTNPIEMYADSSLKTACPGLTGDYESQVTDSLGTLTQKQ